MALNIQDEETDWLVREFARKRGVGITAAVRIAILEASANEQRGIDMLQRRIEPVLAQIRVRKMAVGTIDKEFMDDVGGENN